MDYLPGIISGGDMRALRTYPYNVGRISQSDQFESKNSFVSKQNSQQKTMIDYYTQQINNLTL